MGIGGDPSRRYSPILKRRPAPDGSEDPRWTLICCYNTRHNPCEDKAGHPSYSPLEIWEDDRVLEVGRRQWAAMEGNG